MTLLRLKLWSTFFLSTKKEMPRFDTSKKKVVIALAANYGNLGDVAITFAQKQFLQKNFPEYEVVEFEITNTFNGMKSLKQYVHEDDIITIVGGGNLGDLYDDIEYARQFVIRQFPKNKIIVFPQTIAFSKSFSGQVRLFWAKHVYNAHKNLTLFVRDKFSYEQYSVIFDGMKIAPDIVMSMDIAEPAVVQRDGIVLCFRNDCENGVDQKAKDKLLSELQKKYSIQIRDTHIGSNNDLYDLYKELHRLIYFFRNSRLVITDRLHGMILSYITRTPCIAISGGNKKIMGSYQWIAESNYIYLAESVSCEKELINVLKETDKLYGLKETEKLCVNLEKYFNEIVKSFTNIK